MHAVQTLRRDHVLQHFDGVVLDDANIRQVLLAHQLQQSADARLMHFDAEEIVVGTMRGDFSRRRAHAETDLQNARRASAEHRVPIRLPGRIRHDEARAEFVHCAALARRYAACARHEAADAAQMQRFLRRSGV